MEVNIASDTQTVLGDNFAAVISSCNFDKEVHNFSFSDVDNYDQFSDKEKIAYEITMLLKRQAALDGQESQSDDFSSKLDQYKQCCVDKEIDWDEVLHNVSVELQACSYDTCDDIGKRSEYILSNKAHESLLNIAGPDFEDTIPSYFKDKIDYNDTLDTNPEPFSNFRAIGSGVSGIFNKFKEIIASVKNDKDSFIDFIKDTSARWLAGLIVVNESMRKSMGLSKDPLVSSMCDVDVKSYDDGYTISDAKEDISDNVKTGVKGMKPIVDTTVQAVKDGASEIKDNLPDSVKSIPTTVKNGVKKGVSFVKDRASDFVDNYTDGGFDNNNSDDYVP